MVTTQHSPRLPLAGNSPQTPITSAERRELECLGQIPDLPDDGDTDEQELPVVEPAPTPLAYVLAMSLLVGGVLLAATLLG